MIKVAVAGGTGHTGLHIVEGIVAAGKHEVVVLSRRAGSNPVLDKLGVPAIVVDYADPSSLDGALAGVHTVISTIGGTTPERVVAPQLALLNAALRVGVKRFAPSEFGIRSTPNIIVDLFRLRWPVLDAVMRSGLEYTVFEAGVFMNTLAIPTSGTGHLRLIPFIFDVQNCTADIPGDGTAQVVYIRAEDVGQFVAASLDLEVWPHYSQMRGERLTYNEILRIVEDVRGRKFQTKYLSKEQLQQAVGDNPSINSVSRMAAQWGLEVLGDNPAGYEGKNLNERFPEVQPMGITEFVRTWWSKAE